MRSGDDEAARRVWERFSPRVAALAREKVPAWLRRLVDGDDLANSAMCSLIMGLRNGRFQELRDRDDLWKFEGYTTEEIAGRLGCSRSKVARKLELIRKTWQREGL